MCGIAGVANLNGQPLPDLAGRLGLMNDLIAHRGPDGQGTWAHERGHTGFTHRRLSIIDVETGAQPMHDGDGACLTYNGEIYNYVELRDVLGRSRFVTTSDTEVILRAYAKWGDGCLDRLRGMFAFALWDGRNDRLFCARDRFGIKPFYYAIVDGVLHFGSEVKAIVPFLDRVETDVAALKDYLAFQLCLDGKTLFDGVQELLPGHCLVAENGSVTVRRWWDVQYESDFAHTERYFSDRLCELVEGSVDVHLRSDVPLGAYVSGGVDSGVIASLGAERYGGDFVGFNGRFLDGPSYDESAYARDVAEHAGFDLHVADIGPDDFIEHLSDIVYHLDYPVAGPGSFPQYMVSRLAAQHVKVVLGGQGGDEIFGGYARYLIAYFEQCIKAAIDGTMSNGNFVVTYESIIPNLATLREYKPLLQQFWRDGLFGELDERYFRLVDRAPALANAIDVDSLGSYEPFETFRSIFRADNVGKQSYFDSMTHFDFKTLLPGLLQVEDRVSMAWGLESRVPFIDHEIVEFAATMPADVKFKDGQLKHVLRAALGGSLPDSVLNRTDKMGFPVPLQEWTRGPVYEFICDTFAGRGLERHYLKPGYDPRALASREGKFSRSLWGLLSLELWQQRFHDRRPEWAALREASTTIPAA
jgi:asparagine synthase (glutamine-hydrolysing)